MADKRAECVAQDLKDSGWLAATSCFNDVSVADYVAVAIAAQYAPLLEKAQQLAAGTRNAFENSPCVISDSLMGEGLLKHARELLTLLEAQ